MANLSYFYSCAFFSFTLVLLHLSLHVHGDEGKTQRVISVRSLLPGTVCSSTEGSNPATLKVMHRYGPCSPDPRKRNHGQILRLDQARVDSLHRRFSAASKQDEVGGALAATIPAHSGGDFGTGNYIVKLGFGTPKKDLSVVFDTGSDLTWIQCKPCPKCYTQNEPLFDPSQSSTYRNFSCSSHECAQLDPHTCSPASVCQYSVEYVDESKTNGFYVQDRLTLTPSDVLPNFRFGCGQNNTGNFGTVAGFLGLGRDPVSLVSQAASKYGKVFSYCLPSSSSVTGDLTLGGSTVSKAMFTPMLKDANAGSFYSLTLVAIRVGGQKLAIPPVDFSKPGTILDSVTVITRLPPSAYTALRSTFRQLMPKLYQLAPPLEIFDTCYNLTGHSTVEVPAVSLQFDRGVNVDLDFTGILYVASISQACLAFAANSDADDMVIIGNVQQQTFRVVYDIPNLRIGFVPKACS